MEHGKEHGQSDRWRMEQCHHPGVPMGVPMGSSDVRCRNDDPLAADQLEEKVPFGIQRNAFMAHGDSSLRCYRGDLSVRHG